MDQNCLFQCDIIMEVGAVKLQPKAIGALPIGDEFSLGRIIGISRNLAQVNSCHQDAGMNLNYSQLRRDLEMSPQANWDNIVSDAINESDERPSEIGGKELG